MEETAEQRTVAAAKRYLQMRGYEVLDELECGSTPVIVADDCGEMVFAHVSFGFGEMPHATFDRDRFEQMAGDYIRDNDITDCPVRADALGIMVVADDRALLRHTIGWSNTPEAA